MKSALGLTGAFDPKQANGGKAPLLDVRPLLQRKGVLDLAKFAPKNDRKRDLYKNPAASSARLARSTVRT